MTKLEIIAKILTHAAEWEARPGAYVCWQTSEVPVAYAADPYWAPEMADPNSYIMAEVGASDVAMPDTYDLAWGLGDTLASAIVDYVTIHEDGSLTCLCSEGIAKWPSVDDYLAAVEV